MAINIKDKILVVDDDIQILRSLRLALSSRGYSVSLSSSGEEALDLASSVLPDLIILDLTLPGISGKDVCRELRTWSKVPIIVLSIVNCGKDKIESLDIGADDYITKPFDTGELLARIRAHLRRIRQIPMQDPVFELDELKVNLTNHQVFLNYQEVKLTKTEFALLRYMINNAGRVITYNMFLSQVWGSECNCDTQTLRVHIGNLRKKLEKDHNRPRFILTELGVGYRFVSTNPSR
jgi:two-component system KDP operon response regulator KdpE